MERTIESAGGPTRNPAGRLKVAAAVLLFGAAALAQAQAQEFPKLKPGLWEITTSAKGDTKGAARLTSMCLDDSVQQEMYKVSTGMMAGMCSKHDIKVTGNKITTAANCDLGVSKLQSQTVMTLSGNTSYHTEAHAKFDPPMNGMKESTTIVDGKHVGACKPGQQPGDMTLPNGQTINIRNVMGRKG
jgi:hypothetical protein